MARKSKQEIERHYFDLFRRDYQLPEGTIIHGDRPDVILEGNGKIGIEITNFFIESGAHPESEQIQRERRKAAVSKARQLYWVNGGKGIEISFAFDKSVPIGEPAKLAKRIATLAKNIDVLKTGSIQKDSFKDIPELSFVYLTAKEYEDPQWRVTQCYSGQLMSAEKLRTIVKAKEAQSSGYQHCDAYWLIIVVDFIDPAQDQEIQIDNFEKIASTVFKKVIVYKPHFGHVLEAK